MRKLLQSQRQLRQKRLAAIKKGTVALIDLGSSKVMCLVLSLTDAYQINSFSDVKSQPGVTFRVIGASTIQSRGIRFEVYEMRGSGKCDKDRNSASSENGGLFN